MSLPKVLVFTIIYEDKDYCLDDFIENFKKFTYKNKDHIFIDNSDDGGKYTKKLKEKLEPLGIKVYHVERGNTSREALARSQNFARKIFLDGDWDYFMSLESDIFPKKNIIDRLIMQGANIITAIYMIGHKDQGTRWPCITIDAIVPETGTYGSRLLRINEINDYINKGIKNVAAGGMGCCLMHREVVEKVAFTYIPGLRPHSDVFWFNDARRLGYNVFVDTDVICEHRNSDWADVADR